MAKPLKEPRMLTATCEGCGAQGTEIARRWNQQVAFPEGWCGCGVSRISVSRRHTAVWCPKCQTNGRMNQLLREL